MVRPAPRTLCLLLALGLLVPVVVLADEPSDVVYHLVGAGTDTVGPNPGAEPDAALSTAGNGGQQSYYTVQGSWNTESPDNPFIPTFRTADTVTVGTGATVQLTVHVDYAWPNDAAPFCPIIGALMDAAGATLALGEVIPTTAGDGLGGNLQPVTMDFAAAPGTYDGLMLQLATANSLDCSNAPATFSWGADAVDGRLVIAGGSDPCADDTAAPTLGSIAAEPSAHGAAITWSTDEAADSLVRYGTTSSYGDSEGDSTLEEAHALSLDGLAAETEHHFQVESTDACGNTATSGDLTFTTLADEGVVTAPFVTIGQPSAGQSVSGLVTVSGSAGHRAVGGDGNGDGFVVIAIPDSGINPYHHDFWGETYPRNTDDDTGNDVDFTDYPGTYLDGFPAGVPALDLTIDGSFNLAGDLDVLGDVPLQTLHWIPGTKIIGAYDQDNFGAANSPPDVIPLYDDEDGGVFAGGHGTASASVAVGNLFGSCKECLLVFVESLAGDQWAYQQPWIDIVSTSGGTIANIPSPNEPIGIVPPGLIAQEGQREAAERGVSLLYAGGNGNDGNFLTPGEQTYTSHSTGPDWTMRVGAVNNDPFPGEGYYSIIQSGKPVDISSFGSGNIPAACHTDTTGDCGHSGTSSATPITAGHLGKLILHARQMLGDLGRTGAFHDDGLDAGVVASGAPVAGNPYLEDGLFTRAEAWHILFQSASPLGEGVEFNHIVTVGVGASPVDFAYAGYGVADDAAQARAIAMLEAGTAQLRDTATADQFFALDSDVRNALWGGWDTDADTVPTVTASAGPAPVQGPTLEGLGLTPAGVAADPDLLIDGFAELGLPPVAAAADPPCTGTGSATVSVYLDFVDESALLGTVSLEGPSGACSDAWGITADLSEVAWGEHTLLAAYDDGEGGSAEVTQGVLVDSVATLEFGVPVDVTFAAEQAGRLFKAEVPEGVHRLTVTQTGPACDAPLPLPILACSFDVDLYVRQGEAPTIPTLESDENDCSSASNGNDESCDLMDAGAGTWYVLLELFAGSGTVTLVADLDLPLPPDMDGDGTPDSDDLDVDGDGVPNELEAALGTDPEDDESSPLGAFTASTCAPGVSSTRAARDFDRDGMQAQYWRLGGTEVSATAAGPEAGPGPSYCWFAGDPDDDGVQRVPALPGAPVGPGDLPGGSPIPETAVCVPGADSQRRTRDVDGDRETATYSYTKNTLVVVHPDGSVEQQPGPTYCWLAGDPDDDGVERVPSAGPDDLPGGSPVPETTGPCMPTANSQRRTRDVDRDGETAVYSYTKNVILVLHPDGSVEQRAGPTFCWLYGDLDDDGVERVPEP